MTSTKKRRKLQYLLTKLGIAYTKKPTNSELKAIQIFSDKKALFEVILPLSAP